MTRPLLPSALATLAVTACGGGGSSDLSISASAAIEGSFAVVTATCSEAAQVRAAEISGACTPEVPATLRVPVQKLGGAGAKKITVVGEARGKSVQIETSVEVPATALGPFFKVDKCTDALPGESVDVDVGGGKKLDCRTLAGARLKFAVQGTPGAKLTAGSKTVDVPADGKLDLTVDLGDAILGLSIDDLLDNDTSGPTLNVPWKLQPPGDAKPLEGKFSAVVQFGQHRKVFDQWLRDIHEGKIDRPAFTPRAGGRQTIVLVPSDKYSKLDATDRRGTVREVGMLAMESEVKRVQEGVCEFDSKGKVVKATRFGIELQVKVVGTADGKEIASKVFPAPKGCPSFAMLSPNKPEVAVRPRTEDVTKWLDTVATSAPAAAGDDAPAAGAGSGSGSDAAPAAKP